MGDVFVLEQPPVPLTVRTTNKKGLSGTVHLTDNRRKTLCGRPGPLTLAEKGIPATCKLCVEAEHGTARFRRLIR